MDASDVVLTVAEARELALGACAGLGMSAEDAATVAEHLLDVQLRGHVGLSRLLALRDDQERYGRRAEREITLVEDGPSAAMIDGGDRNGIVVATHATSLAVEKAAASGAAIVGANNHLFSGVLSVYAEQATRRGHIAIAIAAGGVRAGLPLVAPFGGAEGRFTTNPICIGVPTTDGPVIWDITTAEVSGGRVLQSLLLGELLPPGSALDAEGRESRDPEAALAGALQPWGGHRGSGLAVMVHLLGMLCGLPAMPAEIDAAAYLAIVIDPNTLGSGFADRAARAARDLRSTTAREGATVRLPFDNAAAQRAATERDGISVPARVVEQLRSLSV